MCPGIPYGAKWKLKMSTRDEVVWSNNVLSKFIFFFQILFFRIFLILYVLSNKPSFEIINFWKNVIRTNDLLQSTTRPQSSLFLTKWRLSRISMIRAPMFSLNPKPLSSESSLLTFSSQPCKPCRDTHAYKIYSSAIKPTSSTKVF